MKMIRHFTPLETAEHQLHYESYKGVTTKHICKCGKFMCRNVMCVNCWQKEIKKLNKILKQEGEKLK